MIKAFQNKNIRFLLKMLIFLALAGTIFFMLKSRQNLDEEYVAALKIGWANKNLCLILSVLLFPLNWSLEALKWKYLANKIEKISFINALKGVITGVTLGFATPQSIGDYPGRILQLESPDRMKSIGAVFVSRISQFYITLYFGSIALVYYVYFVIQATDANYMVLVYITVFNNLLFIVLFIYHKKIIEILEQRQYFGKLIDYFSIIKAYSFREINFVLLLSLFRYIVFTIQFMLIIYYFDISDNLLIMFLGVSFVFLIKSIIPTFFDLGVRETATVIFFGVYSYNHDVIIFASLTLWIINIVIPTLAGMFLVFRLKFITKKG